MSDDDYLAMRALEDKYTKPPSFYEIVNAFADCRPMVVRLVYDMKKAGCMDYPYSHLSRFLKMTRFFTSGNGFDRADIEKLKQIPIENLFDFQKKRETRDRIQAICPFHDETVPSFIIYKRNNSFHCFSCKKSGDGIKFIQELYQIDFMNAVRRMQQ